MEGKGSTLPEEQAPKGSSTKMIVAIIVIILIVAAIGGAFLLMGGGQEETKANPPVAKLATYSVITDIGSPVTLSAAPSTSDGTIMQYIWYWGDGTQTSTLTASGSHIYSVPGVYLVVVQVVDSNNLTSYSWGTPATITINHPTPPTDPTNSTSPVAIGAASNNVFLTGTKVDFNGASSFAYSEGNAFPAAGDDIVYLSWVFGDGGLKLGTYADASVVNHTYTAVNGALYVASLTVVSTFGTSSSFLMTMLVQPANLPTPGGVKNPDTYIKATIGEPQSLDPAWDYESAGGEIIQQMYETLVSWKGGSATELEPTLALQVPTLENGLISANGLDYTFHLRPNVKFHDGTTMNADDVIYSVKRVLIMNDAEGAGWILGGVMIASYTDLGLPVNQDEINASMTKGADGMTVTFHLIRQAPMFLSMMAYTVACVVSDQFVEAHGGVQVLTKNTFMNRNEAGTGPYKLRLWATNQQIILERFADYWQGQASIQYVIIKKVQDLSTREMMLFSGEADSVYIPNNYLSDVRNRAGVNVVEMLPMYSISFFGLNQNISEGLDIGDIPRTFYSDSNVRQAFVHAFDFQTYIHDILLDTAVQPRGPIPSGMLGYSENVPLQTFDLALAADFLKKAVDTRPGNTGSYADNGFNIWLYYNSGNLGRQAGCQLVKRGLETMSQNATLGISGTITVSIGVLDWPGYLDARAARKLPMFFLGWNVDYPDPDDFANPFCHQGGAFPIFIGMKNQTLTNLVLQAAAELNTTVRAQLYEEIAMSCYINAYYIWCSQPTQNYVSRDWIHGWYYNPTFSDMPGLFYVLTKG